MIKLSDLQQLGKLIPAIFHHRPNRFIGIINVDQEMKTCHVADTGRLREILTEGRQILVRRNRAELKTDYTLLAAKMDDGWVLVNTLLHSWIVRIALEKGVLGFIPSSIRSEVVFGKSRLDFLIDDGLFIEVKASNLLKGNACLFPDAPTTRGKRHLEELIKAKKDGFRAMILLLCLRDCLCFSPNMTLDPVFGKTFEKALRAGVEYKGIKLSFDETSRSIVYTDDTPLCEDFLKK
jgi:sugar fermentation stimulation protein A